MAQHQRAQDVRRSVMRSTQQWMQFNPMNYLAAPQLQQMVAAHERVLCEVEQFANSWFERRHEANQTALRAMRTITSSSREAGDVTTATRIMGEWFTGSLGRITDDLREGFELGARCLGHASRGGMEVGEETLRGVERAGQEAAHLSERATREGLHRMEGRLHEAAEAGEEGGDTMRTARASGKRSS